MFDFVYAIMCVFGRRVNAISYLTSQYACSLHRYQCSYLQFRIISLPVPLCLKYFLTAVWARAGVDLYARESDLQRRCKHYTCLIRADTIWILALEHACGACLVEALSNLSTHHYAPYYSGLSTTPLKSAFFALLLRE